MSRSRRKTPIIGYTTCRSEKQDKQIWHRRWRARERTAMDSIAPESLDTFLPLLENQVSSVWAMGKDGKQYWPIKSQVQYAKQIAKYEGHTPQERAALKQRQLHKWMGK